ncbi:hypothetical protein FVEN_g12602 [Fusarium venenatum]|nr:hypothetical protein FVEN_g12602 [Fusarium venenatum]
MVKLDIAFLAVAVLGPTLSVAHPIDLDDRGAPVQPGLVARQSRKFNCNYASDKRAQATTVAACVDSIADYGKDGRVCPAVRYREVCKKFSSILVAVADGGNSRAPWLVYPLHGLP